MQKNAIIWLTLLMATNLPSLYFGLYLKFDWVDTFQHFLGGFFVAMLMTGYLKDHFLSGKTIQNILIVTGATIFIGVVWEFAEYIANQTLIEPFQRWFGIKAYFMGDLRDTMLDLLMDTLGSLSLIGSHLLWRSYSHKVETAAENKSNSPA
jgi:hypothetical protein